MLIAPQPVVDKQNTNHIRSKVLRRFFFLSFFFSMIIQEMQFHECVKNCVFTKSYEYKFGNTNFNLENSCTKLFL